MTYDEESSCACNDTGLRLTVAKTLAALDVFTAPCENRGSGPSGTVTP